MLKKIKDPEFLQYILVILSIDFRLILYIGFPVVIT